MIIRETGAWAVATQESRVLGEFPSREEALFAAEFEFNGGYVGRVMGLLFTSEDIPKRHTDAIIKSLKKVSIKHPWN